MKFTIALSDLENLLKAAAPRPRKDDTFTLSACAARVFVIECKGDVAGIEALVFTDGAVTLPARSFGELLKTYKGTRFLTLEGNQDGLRMTFRMPALRYDPHPEPPGKFQVFRTAAPPASNTSPPRA